MNQPKTKTIQGRRVTETVEWSPDGDVVGRTFRDVDTGRVVRRERIQYDGVDFDPYIKEEMF